MISQDSNDYFCSLDEEAASVIRETVETEEEKIRFPHPKPIVVKKHSHQLSQEPMKTLDALSRPKQQEAEKAQHAIQQLNFDEDQSNSVSRSQPPNTPLVDDWMRRQRQLNFPKVPVASYDWIDRYASG